MKLLSLEITVWKPPVTSCNFLFSKYGAKPPPPFLNLEYAINLSLNPAYVLNYNLKTVILCKKKEKSKFASAYGKKKIKIKNKFHVNGFRI